MDNMKLDLLQQLRLLRELSPRPPVPNSYASRQKVRRSEPYRCLNSVISETLAKRSGKTTLDIESLWF